ncbi:porin family protein [Empedobacter sedimenti]|uniref:porin family protein n=1 Tax=Empedobacter sedimenti TaxID=3042610 RepID=UPI0024A6A421|nr:porin family protein [Empedobacter sedimenti]
MSKILPKIGFFFLLSNIVFSQSTIEDNEIKSGFFNDLDYQIRGQFSIGGSTPLGIPVEIRELNRYNPSLQLGVEVNSTKWLKNNPKIGIRGGLRIEQKGMKTDARVKNYYTQIDGEGGKQTNGYFTGNVNTTVSNTYTTLPVLIVYNAYPRWNFYGGVYLSATIEQKFTGYVYDGVLREGLPTGTPVVFEGSAKGEYDFSDEMRRMQWGFDLGAEYKMKSHLRLFAELNWNANQLFKHDFDAISFKMYNIYGNFGFGYQF